MYKIAALLVLVSFGSFACYNTYYVQMDDLETIQSAEKGTKIALPTNEEEKVVVDPGTRLFVRDVHGKRYQITPYNFRMINRQLVASDRDYIFMMNQLKPKAEVELLSTWKTVGLISLGAAAVTGLILATVLTAGRKSFD
jgi:hypothetical protein